MMIPQFYGVCQAVNQYVDDSCNTIGTETPEEMKVYVENYLRVLEKFYEHKGFKLNSGK